MISVTFGDCRWRIRRYLWWMMLHSGFWDGDHLSTSRRCSGKDVVIRLLLMRIAGPRHLVNVRHFIHWAILFAMSDFTTSKTCKLLRWWRGVRAMMVKLWCGGASWLDAFLAQPLWVPFLAASGAFDIRAFEALVPSFTTLVANEVVFLFVFSVARAARRRPTAR